MKPSEILEAARGIICDPVNWTKGTSARRKNSHACDPADPSAFRWCALGSLWVAHYMTYGDYLGTAEEFDLLDEAAEELYPDILEQKPETDGLTAAAYINDTLGHTAALRVYGRAIEKAREAEHAAETRTT